MNTSEGASTFYKKLQFVKNIKISTRFRENRKYCRENVRINGKILYAQYLSIGGISGTMYQL